MPRDHFFDWRGFKFAAKVLVLCIIAGTLGRYGLMYAAQSRSASGPSLVLIQETRPAPGKSLSLTLSTSTSRHIINTLTIADTVPPTGKFIAADLQSMVLTLYQEGVAIAKYPIRAKGEVRSPYQTSPGFYTVLKKESDHFNSIERIDLPWSIQFSGNYFIHGGPYGNDGAPVASSYAGGGIELSTDDARSVYEFTETGTNIFVYSPIRTALSSLVLDAIPAPPISATAYMVADVDTGDVFLEQNVEHSFSIASTTRLMTALVANNAIMFDKKIAVAKETFFVGDLLYPLLMKSDNIIAKGLAQTHGTEGFVDWMNVTAKSLDMQSTRFVDAMGTSTENVSNANDLFRLASYLAREKPFILDIANTPSKELIADSGNVRHIENTVIEKGSSISVVSVPVNGVERRAAVIVLNSENYAADAQALTDWFTQSALQGTDIAGTACLTCAIIPPYRKIQL